MPASTGFGLRSGRTSEQAREPQILIIMLILYVDCVILLMKCHHWKCHVKVFIKKCFGSIVDDVNGIHNMDVIVPLEFIYNFIVYQMPSNPQWFVFVGFVLLDGMRVSN